MKTIGLIGGMSWESTLEYYRILNETVKEEMGGFHSAKCILFSVDFQEIEDYQHRGEWDRAASILIDAGRKVAAGGAEILLICTNTMHKLAPQVQAAVEIPLLHIADATAEAIKKDGLKRVGLLGTRFTMEQDFYRVRLEEQHELNVLIPSEDERIQIHSILYNELCLGELKESSREYFKSVIKNLASQGAEGIILGCTEIPLIVEQRDYQIPLYDTTRLHAVAAVRAALA